MEYFSTFECREGNKIEKKTVEETLFFNFIFYHTREATRKSLWGTNRIFEGSK